MGHARIIDGLEADDEDGDGADVLQYDGGVGDEGPEVVWFEAGVSLEIFEKGCLVCVIVGNCVYPC